MPELQRHIHFFDVEFGRFDYDGDAISVGMPGVMQHVAALPIAPPVFGSGSRYSPVLGAGEDSVLMEILGPPLVRGQVRGRFAVKRRSGIPPVEDAGHYRDLTLAAAEGLAEIRHFILWPREGLLGIEINGRGPTISRLRDYVLDKAADVGVEYVRVRMRLAGDQFDILERARRISSATVEVVRDRLDVVGALDSNLEAGLRQLARSTNARTITIDLRLGDRSRDATLELPWRDRARAFLADPEHRSAIARMKVQAFDEDLGRMRAVDLLEDRFVGHETAVEIRSGVVDSDSMYQGIVRSRRALPPSE
jgi:hypothetical protein